MALKPTPFRRYGGSGTSCLHRTSVLSTLARELSGPFWVLADIALCAAALALGTPIEPAHVAVFIATASAWSGWPLWRNAAAPGSSRPTLPLLLLPASPLALAVPTSLISFLP